MWYFTIELNASVSQLSHWLKKKKRSDNNIKYLTVWLWGLNELVTYKNLEQYLAHTTTKSVF